MAIAYEATGAPAVATGTTTLSVAYPTTVAAGNLLILFIANKYPTNGPATPDGWTAPSGNQYSRGGGTPGVDTGDVYITLFLKIADGTETGNVSVTLTGANTSIGRIFRYSKDASKDWEYVCAGGSDNAAGTSWSVTAGSNPGVTANDMVLVGSGICGNTNTATAEAITQTGVTFGTMQERQDSGSNTGDDIAMWMTEHPVSSGTGSAAPVYTATVAGTGSATAAGASLFLRLREVLPPITGTLSVTLDDATLAGAGDVAIEGALAATLDDATLAGAGTVGSGGIAGTLDVTLSDVTLAGAGDVAIEGALNSTLDDLVLAGSGDVAVQADASITLDDLALAGTGDVAVAGDLSVMLGDATLTGSGDVAIDGALAATLDDLALAGIGDVAIEGALDITLDNLTLAGSGIVGTAPIVGTLNITLDDAALAGAGDVDVAGDLSVTLDGLTLAGAGGVAIEGVLDVAPGNLALAATGTVEEASTEDQPGWVEVSLVLNGYVAAERILNGWVDAGWELNGRVEVEVQVAD